MSRVADFNGAFFLATLKFSGHCVEGNQQLETLDLFELFGDHRLATGVNKSGLDLVAELRILEFWKLCRPRF